jgi:hypothetical protein
MGHRIRQRKSAAGGSFIAFYVASTIAFSLTKPVDPNPVTCSEQRQKQAMIADKKWLTGSHPLPAVLFEPRGEFSDKGFI